MFGASEEHSFQDCSQDIVNVFFSTLGGFQDVLVPTLPLCPGGVSDEVEEGEEVGQAVLDGRPREAPSVGSFKFVDSFGCLDDSTFDIVSLVQYNSIPFESEEPCFADVGASGVLM